MLGEAIGGLLPSAVAVALSPIPIIGVVLVLGTPRRDRRAAQVDGLGRRDHRSPGGGAGCRPRWGEPENLALTLAASASISEAGLMSENSAVIMMVVLLLLGAKLLGDGLGGIASL